MNGLLVLENGFELNESSMRSVYLGHSEICDRPRSIMIGCFGIELTFKYLQFLVLCDIFWSFYDDYIRIFCWRMLNHFLNWRFCFGLFYISSDVVVQECSIVIWHCLFLTICCNLPVITALPFFDSINLFWVILRFLNSIVFYE